MNKRVGLILFDFPKYSETFFVGLITVLCNCGNEVIVFANQKSLIFKSGSEIIFPIRSKKNNYFLFLNLILALILKPKRVVFLFSLNRVDGMSFFINIKKIINSCYILIYNLDIINFGFANIGLDLQNVPKVIGAKSILSMRGFDIAVFPITNNSVAYTSLFSKIDIIHSISEDLLLRAYDLGLSREKSFHIIKPAINSDFFKLENLEKLKQILVNRQLTITTIGRLHWIKNYKDILKAMQILKYDFKIDFCFNIVGTGQINENESLKFLVNELNLNSAVHFHGKKDFSGVKQILENTDIYIQYSLHEGFCNSLLEAQSMGCIVVASNVGGIPENIIDNETGFLVESQRPDILAQKIVEIISLKEDILYKIRYESISRIKKQFNIKLKNQEFMKLFKS